MSLNIRTRPGDWICDVCLSCGAVNFARRMQCYSCNRPRTTVPAAYPVQFAPAPVAYAQPSVRPGDWFCNNCHFLNYAYRNTCKNCGASIAADQVRQTTNSYGTGSLEMREGDWICPSCQFHNFASRSQCYKCGKPHP